MPKVRKDNKGRNLRTGETQRSDGSYMFVYKLGTKKKYIYDTDLASLRAKEKQIAKDADDGIRTQEAMKLTLNDMFKVYMDNNIRLKPSTRANYEYLSPMSHFQMSVEAMFLDSIPNCSNTVSPLTRWRASTPSYILLSNWL